MQRSHNRICTAITTIFNNARRDPWRMILKDFIKNLVDNLTSCIISNLNNFNKPRCPIIKEFLARVWQLAIQKDSQTETISLIELIKMNPRVKIVAITQQSCILFVLCGIGN